MKIATAFTAAAIAGLASARPYAGPNKASMASSNNTNTAVWGDLRGKVGHLSTI